MTDDVKKPLIMQGVTDLLGFCSVTKGVYITKIAADCDSNVILGGNSFQ